MIISLLHIVVPTILILAIMIPYINSRSNRVMEELREIRTQLEKLDSTAECSTEEKKEAAAEPAPDSNILVEQVGEEKAEKDAEIPERANVDASEYNTGKSGKIYTKEELELLIKE